MNLLKSAFLRFLAALPLALAAPAPSRAAAYPDNVTVRDFFDIPFNHPVVVTEIPGRDSAYVIAGLFGEIFAVERIDGEWVTSLFDSLPVLPHNENGLMGFAFHPDYERNGKYYVYYVLPPAPGINHLVERVADSTRLKASGEPERVLLVLKKPYYWHNGGTLAFGADGYLYTALGDGGGEGDPWNRAQNPGELHGKFLRIDVDGPDAFPEDTARNYAIPPGNPFSGNPAYLPEIWALGLRSPWKWSFHPRTGEIWLGDVGQIRREKVTLIPKGSNLGWRTWEGFSCFAPPCSWTGIIRPVLDLPRSESRSVIGGVFYHGPGSPFHDAYVFGDYVTGKIWALSAPGGALSGYQKIAEIPRVTSFYRDSRGRILATAFDPPPGRIFILESPDFKPAAPQDDAPPSSAPLARAELLRNRDRYVIRDLHGRKVDGMPKAGLYLVLERNSRQAPRLMRLD